MLIVDSEDINKNILDSLIIQILQQTLLEQYEVKIVYHNMIESFLQSLTQNVAIECLVED